MTRRIFLAASMGALFGSVGQVSAEVDPTSIGNWPAAGLMEALADMASVGSRRPEAIMVLASPGCAKAAGFLRVLRSAPAEIRWLPFGWSQSDDVRVAAFMRSGIGGLEAFLTADAPPVPSGPADMAAALVQRKLFEDRVALLLFRSTARVPAAPTLVLPTGPDSARVVRGAPDVDTWHDMVELASKTRL